MADLPLFGFDREPGNVRAVQEGLVCAAVEQFGCDISTLFPFNPVTGAYVAPPAVAGHLLAPEEPFDPPRPNGITQRALSHRKLIARDVSKTPEFVSAFTEREKIQSFAAIALRSPSRTHPLAVIYLDYRKAHSFPDDEQERLMVFAQRGAALLQAAWLLERYRKVISIGHTVNEDLQSETVLFTRLNNRIGEIIDAKHCFLLGVRAGRDRVSLQYTFANQVHRGTPAIGTWEEFLETEQPVRLGPDVLTTPPFAAEALRGARSGLLVPLYFRRRAVGFIAAFSEREDSYDEQDVHVLSLLANHAATAVNDIRAFSSLMTLSRMGQKLTRTLEDEDVGANVAAEVLTATGANVVILYPYHDGQFDLPPILAGTLLHPEYPQPVESTPGDMPSRIIHERDLLFTPDAALLPSNLGSPRRSIFQEREGIASAVAAPLRVADEIVGAMFINYREVQVFGASQRQLLRGLAAFGAIALKNARQFSEQTKRRNREFEIIGQIDRKLNQSTTLNEVLKTIIEGANTEIRAEAAAIILVDAKRTKLEAVATNGYHTDRPWEQSLDAEKGIVKWVFEHGLPARVGDVYNDPIWRDRFIDDGRGSTRAELDVPLIDETEESSPTIGVLNFESSHQNAFSEKDEQFVQLLSRQVVLGIKKARLYDDARGKTAELEQLVDYAQTIVSHLELPDLLNASLRKSVDITGADAGVVLWYDRASDDLRVKAHHGIAADVGALRFPLQDVSVVASIARTRQPFIGVPETADPNERLLYAGLECIAGVALHVSDDLTGILLVGREANAFPHAQVQLLTAIADMTSIALQNAERYAEAETERDRLDALRQLSAEILAQWEEPGRVLGAIVETALRLLNASRADLDVYRDGILSRTYAATWNGSGTVVETTDLTDAGPDVRQRGIMEVVRRDLRPYRTKIDAQKDDNYTGGPNVHSELAVPLIDPTGRKTAIGVLNVESEEILAFDENDEELLGLFAQEAIIAFEISHARDQAKRQLRRFDALFETGHRLAELPPALRDLAYRIVCEKAARECNCLTVLRLLDNSTEELVETWRSGEGAKPFARIPVNEGLNGLVYRRKRAARVDDLKNPPAWAPPVRLSDLETRSLMVAPIHVGRTYYGSIGMSHPLPNHFDDTDQRLIEGLARLLSVTFNRMDGAVREDELRERALQSDVLAKVSRASWEIAHRLGNDLGRVKTHVNRARRLLVGGDVQAADARLDRIKTDVNRVLDMSVSLKAAAGKLGEMKPETFLLKHALSGVDQLVKPPDDVSLTIVVPQGLKVHADLNHVTSIIQHLVENSLEAMPDKGALTVVASQAGHEVTVDVADTGPGIAPRDQPHIFKFLFTTKANGSGYGLWAALQMAEANGGKLSLASSSAKGTTFRLVLPASPDEPRR